jgi:hypothetical protein
MHFHSQLPMKLSDKKLKLREELGVIHEHTGIQPAMARVIALLLSRRSLHEASPLL